MKTQHPSQRLFVYIFCSMNVVSLPLLNKGDIYLINAVERVVKCSFAISSQEFGGGGHASASSFMLSSAELELWKVGKNALT